ncbi:MAG: amino acid adenylation domain-containing protein [Polyangiaceae bacterium]
MLEFASISFDGAVDQWMAPLMLGARVVVRGGEMGSTEATYDKLFSEGVTIVDILPAYALALARMCDDRSATLPLRICSVGGEALPRESYEFLQRVFPSARVINGYGPTEAIVTPMIWEAGDGEASTTSYAPIGWPVGERTTQILDTDGQPVPEGVTGELYLGGVGLSRGYLRRPDLTAERFVPDPWGAPGARLYRTGDRARYRSDGTVEYVGRVDEQVKLRGYRIELGEIETELLAHEDVAEAVALIREAGAARQLIAYAVPRSSASRGDLGHRLRERLVRALPDYMVPSAIAVIERMPRTPSGKIDRRALPDITLPKPNYRDPSSESERALAAIWREVLQVPRVGATDHFFELGGDSILSLQIVSRARKAGLRLSPRDVFAHPTLEAMARVAGAIEHEPDVLGASPVEGDVALLPIQKAFFEEAGADHHWYNQGVLLTARRKIAPASLARALDAVLEHHDSLRLRFHAVHGKWSQRYAPKSAVHGIEALSERDAPSAGELDRIIDEAQRSLHVEKGPLFRAVLIGLGDGSQRLLLVAHHLVVDGVSWRILLEDLESAYRSVESEQPPRFAARSSSYQAWATALQTAAESAALQNEIHDWENACATVVREPRRDFDVERAVRADAVTLTSILDADRTERLLRVAPAAYRTQIDELLVAALALAVSQWTGDSRVAIELEGHGREDIAPGIELARTVGWFTTIYPVQLQTFPDLAATLLETKEHLRHVPSGGIGFGVLRYLATDALRSRIAALPRPRITFNYLGQFDSSAARSELFNPAREDVGHFQSPGAPLANWIEINAAIHDGRLSVRWTFARTMFRAETVQSVMDGYRDELEKIVEHCCTAVGAVSPSDFPLASLSVSDLRTLPFAPRDIEDVYPLTPLQKGMLFHALLEPSSASYVTQSDVAIDGVDVERLALAWCSTVARHPVLRSAIAWSNLPHPVQVVLRDAEDSFEVLDWRDVADVAERLQDLRSSEHRRGFDLAKPPLQRVVLVRVSSDRYHLVWTSHHLLLDGWSSARFLGEVVARYAGELNVEQLGPRAGVSFRHYVAWLAERDANATERFWRERLANVNDATLLASSFVPSARQRGYASQRHRLSDESTARLRDFASRAGVTVSTVLQGAWAVLLARYAHDSSVVFGLTVAGRPAALTGVESALGLFINTVPVAPRLEPGREVIDFLRALQAGNAELEEHAHAPLYEIQRWQGQAGRPLFDTVLVFENYPIDQALQRQSGPLRFGEVRSIDWTNFPLTLIVVARDAISLQYQYDLGLFEESAIAGIARQFESIVRQIVEGDALRIGEVALVADGDALDDSSTLDAWDEPMHVAIVRQMRATPDGVALCADDEVLTYRDLEQRVSELASRLRSRGVGPEVLVGIFAHRSFAMVVAILGVLQAGGAYVPLEPDLPDDRLSYMLEDCGAAIVLTEPSLAARAATLGRHDVVLIGDRGAKVPISADVHVRPANLAYVIYTSGSTGRPKGAANTHAGLGNRLRWMQSAYALGPGDVVLQKTPFGFDVSVWEFLWPLMVGARLVLAPPGEHRDPEALAALIRRHGVSTVHFVPSMLRAFLQTEGAAHCDSLRRIVSSGEALTADIARDAANRLPRAALYNLYGPTEASIDVTHFTCPASPNAAIPIGRPIANAVVRVLDRDLNELPAGVAGELYIGGVVLARGYHNHPSLTAERFVPDPFSVAPGARLYRTGDRAMKREDGEIDYLGRLDHQVKVRGLRIELGEIETQLRAHSSIEDAVVVARDDGAGAHLVAYVVSREKPPSADLAESLTAHAKSALPEYMVPAVFVAIDELPRLSSGKVDRKSLPALRTSSSGEPLRTNTERALAAIWNELLGVDDIGARDHFFQLGGHSLLAVQLVSRVRVTLGIEIVVRDVFDHPRLDELATLIDEKTARTPPSDVSEDELAGAIAEIEGLSAEELQALLAEGTESEAS